MADNLLEARQMRKEFGGLVAVSDITFTIPQGAIVSLIGPNGAGKTTFFNMITGVYKPTFGRVVFDGHDVTGKPPHAVTERGIGRTFQNIRLFQHMTALENVLVGMHCRTRAGLAGIMLKRPGVEAERRRSTQRAHELLAFFGDRLLPRAQDAADTLSYANRRRLEIARALATQPKLMLLDEPAAGMNPTEKRELMHDIRRIRELGITVALIEHDMGLVQGICERVVVLDHGVKIAEGSFKDVREDPAVMEAYLGRQRA